jgi:hypothetical protein
VVVVEQKLPAVRVVRVVLVAAVLDLGQLHQQLPEPLTQAVVEAGAAVKQPQVKAVLVAQA